MFVKMIKDGVVSQVNKTCVESHQNAGWIVTDKAATNAPDIAPVSAPVVDSIKTLRDQYKAATGKRAFMGWDADTIKTKLAELD